MSIVCYIPMLEGQLPEMDAWLATVPQRFGITPVLLPQVDWNNDLTPWPSGPIFKKGKPFGGQADAYLQRLVTEIIPSLEKPVSADAQGCSMTSPAIETVPVITERWLLGVSLAGLFAVWASAKTSLFTRVAAVSGSFWYPGFSEWLAGQSIQAKSCYLSLGDQEASGKNPHLKSIAVETDEVVQIIRSQGVPTTFEWTSGTHFGPLIPRLDQALAALSLHL